jgi:CRP-like cAMP-binding protein
VPVETRLARRLLDLARLFGGDVSVGRPVTIPVTQSELATMAGTSRQTCNRILHQMAEDGVVLLQRGRTEVVDPAALHRLAAG